MTVKAIDGWQGAVALVGITLGVVPLVMIVSGSGDGGLWRLVLDDSAGALRWVFPLLVVVAGIAAIAALERRKRRG